MDVKLSQQVRIPENVWENFKKIEKAFKSIEATGLLKYKGSWNASTNVITSIDLTINGNPIPAASSSNEGWYFIINTDGTTSEGGITDWKINDWIVSIGTIWVKVNNNGGGGGGGGTWGSITGTLTDQTDLNDALEELQAQINAGNKLFNYYNFI